MKTKPSIRMEHPTKTRFDMLYRKFQTTKMKSQTHDDFVNYLLKLARVELK